MDKKLYLAYGSNMNLKQMEHRCPTAKQVGSVVLKDYELLFRGGHESAVATIEPSVGKAVPCLLWEIIQADEAALNRYEGYPFLYRKETVEVEHNGKKVKAMVYVMNENNPYNTPSCYYYSSILEGYNTAGLDISVLKQAAEESAKRAGMFYG